MYELNNVLSFDVTLTCIIVTCVNCSANNAISQHIILLTSRLTVKPSASLTLT